ncbi:MAG: hypothetical protein VYD90_10530 [Pseudomonadota bacterium]|nr:hypothetical protein [Pseudomonadota bacterium]
MGEEVLPIWTITKSPADFPGKFVARKHLIPGGVTEDHRVADTLEGVRAMLPPHLVNLGRETHDAPVIVESWI